MRNAELLQIVLDDAVIDRRHACHARLGFVSGVVHPILMEDPAHRSRCGRRRPRERAAGQIESPSSALATARAAALEIAARTPTFAGIAPTFAPKERFTSTDVLELNSISVVQRTGVWKVVRKGGIR